MSKKDKYTDKQGAPFMEQRHREGLYFFPEYLNELNREVVEHPKLMEMLAETEEEFESRIAVICTYCSVVIEETFYTSAELEGLCKMLMDRLYTRRTGILLN